MEKDSFEYSQSLAGKSWGRIDFNSDSWCLQEPTKNQSNGSCLTDSANDSNKGAVNLVFSPTPTKNILTKTTNFIQSKTTKKMTAKKIENPVLKVDNRSLFLQKGEVLGEKTEMNNEKTKKIFVLPFFYSLAGAILSLKKILEQLPA
jgi:hypothetical protein